MHLLKNSPQAGSDSSGLYSKHKTTALTPRITLKIPGSPSDKSRSHRQSIVHWIDMNADTKHRTGTRYNLLSILVTDAHKAWDLPLHLTNRCPEGLIKTGLSRRCTHTCHLPRSFPFIILSSTYPNYYCHRSNLNPPYTHWAKDTFISKFQFRSFCTPVEEASSLSLSFLNCILLLYFVTHLYHPKVPNHNRADFVVGLKPICL